MRAGLCSEASTIQPIHSHGMGHKKNDLSHLEEREREREKRSREGFPTASMSLVVAEKKARASDGDVERATKSAAAAVGLSSSPTSPPPLNDFLTNNGLGAFVERFRDQGFLYAGDVLGLTPRKYKAVGVSRA